MFIFLYFVEYFYTEYVLWPNNVIYIEYLLAYIVVE